MAVLKISRLAVILHGLRARVKIQMFIAPGEAWKREVIFSVPVCVPRRLLFVTPGLIPVLLVVLCFARPPGLTQPTFKVEEADLSTRPSFIVYGDTRFTRWQFAGKPSSPWARKSLVEKIASENPEALFITGDVPFRGADFSDYSVFQKETRAWSAAHLQTFPVLGNHEFYQRDFFPSESKGLRNWWRAFPYLNDMRWYSVQIGPQIYVLCLDSEFGALQDGGAQRSWMKTQLSNLPDSIQYVFCILHHAHISDYMEDHAPASDLERHGELTYYLEHEQEHLHARIVVVSGHVHNYGRFERHGVVYVIAGGGGAHPVFFARRPDDNFRGKDLVSGGRPLPNYHYVKFEHTPSGLAASMVRISNPSAAYGKPIWDSPDRFDIVPVNR